MRSRLLSLAGLALIAAASGASAEWQRNGNLVYAGAAGEALAGGCVAARGSGGAIVAWTVTEYYSATYSRDLLFAVGADGAGAWSAVSECARHAFDLRLVPDGAGGAFGACSGLDASGSFCICPIRMLSDGTRQTFPVALFEPFDFPRSAGVVPDGAGGALYAWSCDKIATGTGFDIFMQRVDALNNRLWGSDCVCVLAAAYDQCYPELASDGKHGAIVVWIDGGGDLYAQRIGAAGTVLWPGLRVAVCTEAEAQTQHRVLADGSGGAFVAWRDERFGGCDIYAQRLDSLGTPRWVADGVPVCEAAGDQELPLLASDGSGGAYIVWSDARSGDRDIYAQRVDGSGSPQWGIEGVPVAAGAGDQAECAIAPDFSGNLIVAWVERGGADDDIYAQKIGPSGAPLWKAGGVPVCVAPGNQNVPAMTPDGTGGAFVAWRDFRTWSWGEIYAARLREDIIPVETLLQFFDAALDGSAIRITWRLAAAGRDLAFEIVRTDVESGAREAIERPEIMIDGTSYAFVDRECEPGRSYSYRVDAIDGDGRKTLFETAPIAVPALSLALRQNYPNPFNPSTVIRYRIPERARVTLDVFDVRGRLVARLVDRETPAGEHEALWDGRDGGGAALPTGVYLCRLRAGASMRTIKALLLR